MKRQAERGLERYMRFELKKEKIIIFLIYLIYRYKTFENSSEYVNRQVNNPIGKLNIVIVINMFSISKYVLSCLIILLLRCSDMLINV